MAIYRNPTDIASLTRQVKVDAKNTTHMPTAIRATIDAHVGMAEDLLPWSPEVAEAHADAAYSWLLLNQLAANPGEIEAIDRQARVATARSAAAFALHSANYDLVS